MYTIIQSENCVHYGVLVLFDLRLCHLRSRPFCLLIGFEFFRFLIGAKSRMADQFLHQSLADVLAILAAQTKLNEPNAEIVFFILRLLLGRTDPFGFLGLGKHRRCQLRIGFATL